jgi:hypothetical protein
MKKLFLALVVFAVMALASGTAYAGGIGFTGSLSVDAAHNFSFTAGHVGSVNGYNCGATTDTLCGTGDLGVEVNLTGQFVMQDPNGGNTADFVSTNGFLSIGNKDTGTLTGNVQLLSITSSGSYFDIAVTITNVQITAGTSAYLTKMAGSHPAVMTLNFTAAGGPTLDQLYHWDGKDERGNPISFMSPYQGSVNIVPEPATLALLGTGFLATGGWLRRRILK